MEDALSKNEIVEVEGAGKKLEKLAVHMGEFDAQVCLGVLPPKARKCGDPLAGSKLSNSITPE